LPGDSFFLSKNVKKRGYNTSNTPKNLIFDHQCPPLPSTDFLRPPLAIAPFTILLFAIFAERKF
jgi:hypothetical protein